MDTTTQSVAQTGNGARRRVVRSIDSNQWFGWSGDFPERRSIGAFIVRAERRAWRAALLVEAWWESARESAAVAVLFAMPLAVAVVWVVTLFATRGAR